MSNDLFFQQISGEMQLAFKKLSKKDSITKLKGLHDLNKQFSELQQQSQGELEAALQSWVGAFVKGALEEDPKVRAALCHAHATLARLAKKKLAPHLKTIMVFNSNATLMLDLTCQSDSSSQCLDAGCMAVFTL